jgi:two-component system nitrate/nitrite response regulator NarL
MNTDKLQINLAICDDHQVVLEGLRLILNQVENLNLVGMFHTPESLIGFLEHAEIPPDVIILDAHLGNNKNGLDVLSQVPNSKKYRWILFSSYVDKYLAFQAEKAGFQACLSKEVPASVLVNVLTDTNIERFVCHPQIQNDEKFRRNMENVLEAKASLTKRETEVLGEILTGSSAKDSANKLHISIYTFETHKKNIFRKFDVNSTNELMRIAIDFNLF